MLAFGVLLPESRGYREKARRAPADAETRLAFWR